MGVVHTMTRVYGGQPIQTQASYIDEVRRIGVRVFDSYIRRNDTMYGEAREYGVPVVLRPTSGPTYERLVEELEELTTEFISTV